MNSKVQKPLIEFIGRCKFGTWMCDFQFESINYADNEVACSINSSINRVSKTFIIEIEDADIELCNERKE